jgi:hypothetical protein
MKTNTGSPVSKNHDFIFTFSLSEDTSEEWLVLLWLIILLTIRRVACTAVVDYIVDHYRQTFYFESENIYHGLEASA